MLVLACKTAPSPVPAGSTDHSRATHHFVIRWTSSAATEGEVDAVEARAEGSYARFSQLLGHERMPKRILGVRLKGDAQRGEGSTVSTEAGELVLVRFPGPGGGYDASLSHELMHQVRWDMWTNPKLQTDAFLHRSGVGFRSRLARPRVEDVGTATV